MKKVNFSSFKLLQDYSKSFNNNTKYFNGTKLLHVGVEFAGMPFTFVYSHSSCILEFYIFTSLHFSVVNGSF